MHSSLLCMNMECIVWISVYTVLL